MNSTDCSCFFLERSFSLHTTDDKVVVYEAMVKKNLTIPSQSEMMINGKLKRWCHGEGLGLK